MLVRDMSESAFWHDVCVNNVPFLLFEAICSCQNGGTCVAPNLCRCQSGYAGNSCQTRKTICFKYNAYYRFNWKLKDSYIE